MEKHSIDQDGNVIGGIMFGCLIEVSLMLLGAGVVWILLQPFK